MDPKGDLGPKEQFLKELLYNAVHTKNFISKRRNEDRS